MHSCIHTYCMHPYADDTQIYGFCSPLDTAVLADRMVSCISDVSAWMKSNRLQLNTAKTVCGVRQIDSSI